MLVLLSRREGGIRRSHVGIAAAARWRPADARESRGVLGVGQRGRDRAGPKERRTRGWGRSRRWMAAACTAVARGGVLRRRQGRQRKQSRRAGARGGRRKGRGSKDWFAKQKKYRDPIVKKDFPLI
jgi:hypothetical protein